MKNNLVKISVFAFLVLSIGFIACEKDNEYIEGLKQDEIDAREAYLEAEGITIAPTASGLYYIETETGTGVQAKAGDVVIVNYEGQLLNGYIFDTSWKPDGDFPIEFTLGTGAVIAGWDEAIALMKEGGKAKLIIPSDLAYGAQVKQSIPAYSTLVFYVDLVDVK
ncbi:MAG: FKBP-type peptidyl-prolyl cis-trans isomerase [Bacteroidota bacterium]